MSQKERYMLDISRVKRFFQAKKVSFWRSKIIMSNTNFEIIQTKYIKNQHIWKDKNIKGVCLMFVILHKYFVFLFF